MWNIYHHRKNIHWLVARIISSPVIRNVGWFENVWSSFLIKNILRSFFVSPEIMDKLIDFMGRTTTPFYAWFGSDLFIFVDHPDDVQAVLTSKSCLEKPYFFKYLSLDASLFTAPGKTRQNRQKETTKRQICTTVCYFFSKHLAAAAKEFKHGIQSENFGIICTNF